MGNELTQVGNVSTATPVNYGTGINTGFNTAMPNSLFSMPKDYSNDMIMPDFLKTGNITDEQRASIFGPMTVTNAQVAQSQQPAQNPYPQQVQYSQPQAQYPQQQVQYSQGQAYPQQQYPAQYAQYPQQNPYAPAFSGQGQPEQVQMTPEQMSEYYEKLLAENPNIRITEKGNIYEVSDTGKRIGILGGICTALAGGIKKLCTGTALKSAFNLKSLAIKVPVLALAGWAVGSLIDAFTNSKKAQQADAQTQNA